jgi:hypothetical protein
LTSPDASSASASAQSQIIVEPGAVGSSVQPEVRDGNSSDQDRPRTKKKKASEVRRGSTGKGNGNELRLHLFSLFFLLPVFGIKCSDYGEIIEAHLGTLSASDVNDNRLILCVS